MNRRDFWINLAFFQAAWPACVIGASAGLLWPGLIVVAAFALWQLAGPRRHPADIRVVSLFAGTGVLLDTLWQRLGIVDYALQWPVAGAAPLWLVLLWVALGLAVNHCLAAFRAYWKAWLVLAAVGSPLSYAAAAGFGAVEWSASTALVVLCMGPVWAMITGLLFRQAGIWNQHGNRTHWIMVERAGG